MILTSTGYLCLHTSHISIIILFDTTIDENKKLRISLRISGSIFTGTPSFTQMAEAAINSPGIFYDDRLNRKMRNILASDSRQESIENTDP